MAKIKRCECCRKEINNFGGARWCSSCAVYIKDLKQQLRYYKSKLKESNYKLYGAPDGNQKIRWKK